MIKLARGSKYINKSMKTTVSVQRIIHFISTIIEEDFVDNAEKHDFWEIVYLESGEAIVNADGSEIRLFPGEAYFHKPGEAHSIKAVNGAITVFFISFHSISKIMAIFEGLKISFASEQRSLIYKMYKEARNIFEKGERPAHPEAFVSKSLLADSPLGSQQLYRLYLEELLLTSLSEVENEKNIVTYDSKEKLEKIILEKIITLLSENIYSSVSIDGLCKTLNYSRTYLSTLFKKHRKASIISYYNSLKIKEAKKLLLNNSVSSVSEMLSFNNPYYFSRVFKRYEGMSPSEYQAKNKF